MTRLRKRFLPLILALVLLPLGYAVAPIYSFLAEDHPALRGPWGWIPVPEQAPYQEGVVDPAYRAAADAARDILSRHRLRIFLLRPGSWSFPPGKWPSP